MKKLLSLVFGWMLCFTLLTITASAAGSWVTVPGIEGGQIEFDPTTGTISDAEETITQAIIPSEIEGYQVTVIGGAAFRDCTSLKTVVIPDSVTRIEYKALRGAFAGCTSLESVVIPDSVTMIYTGTFYCCTSLKDVVIPDSVTYIGWLAFQFCTSLEEIIIPSSVSSIGEYAFCGCTSLKSVVIPDSVSYVGSKAFYGCTNLSTLSFGPSITSLTGWLDQEICGTIILPSSIAIKDKEEFLSYPLLRSLIFSGTQAEWQESGYLASVPVICSDGIFTDSTITIDPIYQNNFNFFYQEKPTVVNRSIDQTVIDKSNEICQGLETSQEKLVALYSWVTDNISYNYAYYNGYTSTVVTSAVGVLEVRTTVCEGYANLLRDLVQAQGIPCVKVHGCALGASTSVWLDETNHAWNEAYIEEEDRWIILDSTWDKQDTTWDYFDPSLTFFSEKHRIDKYDDFYLSEENMVDVTAISSWAEAGVLEADARLGIVPWDMRNNYTQSITRQAFCKLADGLIEAYSGKSAAQWVLETDTSSRTTVFSDTKNTYVKNLYLLGVVNGKGDGLFAPDDTITRQEAAVMLANIATFLSEESLTATSTITFQDQSDIPSWASTQVALLSGLGVMEGSDGNFNPTATYTNEQAILTMSRLYQVLEAAA